MVFKVSCYLCSLVLLSIPTSGVAQDRPQIEELYFDGGDRILPWTRCAAFYQSTFNMAKRHGQEFPDTKLLDAENDMATIASILLIEYSNLSDVDAITRIRNEILPLVSRYEEILVREETNSGIPFYESNFWRVDGAACAKMRDAVAPSLRAEE